MKRQLAIYSAGGLSIAIAEKIKQWDNFEFTIAGQNPSEEFEGLLIPPMGIETAEIIQAQEKLSIPIYYANPQILYSKNCMEPIRRVDYSKPWLRVFEYHVNDHCNMNCKGCGHCANLFKEPTFTDFAEYDKDINRIRELYDGVGLIRLLGGEPLLNRKLDCFIERAREIFPEAELHIVTNGILLLDIPEKLIQTLVQTGTHVDVSLYPPMIPEKKHIEAFLQTNDIDYCITQSTEFYRRFLPEGNGNKIEAFRHCSSARNHLLSKGRIASCAMPFSIDKLCSVYPLQIENSGWIPIHDPEITGFEINRRLNNPTELCRYCSSRLEKYEWEQSQQERCDLTDWIYSEVKKNGRP